MKLTRLKNDGKPELKLNPLQMRMKAQVDAKVKDVTYQFEEISCPICSSENHELLGEKDRYGLYFSTAICRECGFMLTSPRMTQASYNDFYNIEYRKLYVGSERATATFFEHQKRKGKVIYDFLHSNKILTKDSLYVLEVGCGAGGIVDYFRERGNTVKGIDLGAEYIEYGKKEHGLDLEVGTLKGLENKEKPDLIIYSHVLEHILDLNEEIQLVRELSHQDTVVYIEVPGVKEIHINYQSNILRYLQNAHTFHFTLESLKNLMSKNGFGLVHGTQFVQSAFRLNEEPFALKSDYESVTNYIKDIEKKRKKYPYTFAGMKANLKKFLLKILDATGTRGLFRKK